MIPLLHLGGGVFTQGEFRGRDPLLTDTLGQKTPDYIVVIQPQDKYWIIEAKRPEQSINSAAKSLKKAVNQAKSYANKINKQSPGAARFATGVVGNDRNDQPISLFYVETYYWNDREWALVQINQYKTTGFLIKEQCQDIIERNDASIHHYDVAPDKFLEKANAINEEFHANEILASDRAKVMAALLLALAQDRNLRIHEEPQQLVEEINTSVTALLRKCGKEDFANELTLRPPASEKNHNKYRTGIVQALQHLRDMNIRSAINSGDDALGKFYETFLSYANDAKKMGIVLTPRHITRFAAEVTCVSHKDIIFDPACGTGGFLIAALDHIRRVNPSAREEFGQENLYGVETTDAVYGLAVVNMIFRGDGNSHIYDGDCFKHQFWRKDGKISFTETGDKQPDLEKPFTRILMNPPFSLKNTHPSEFVNYALEQTRKGGLCFAILPTTCFTGKKQEEWRKALMAHHTIKAVITLDKSLFSPVSTSTCGIVVEAHKPHRIDSGVFFGVLRDDKHRLKVSKVVSKHHKQDNLKTITDLARDFMCGKRADIDLPREALITKINPDRGCLFAPEAYLNNEPSPLIDPLGICGRAASLNSAKLMVAARQSSSFPSVPNALWFPLSDFIASEQGATVPNLKDLPPGDIPVVSATEKNNGIADWKDVSTDHIIRNFITISKTHNTKPCQAFWHTYDFAAIATVHIIKPIRKFSENEDAILYLCQSITQSNAWKYRYERPVLLHELKVYLPATKQGGVDMKRLTNIAKHMSKA